MCERNYPVNPAPIPSPVVLTPRRRGLALASDDGLLHLWWRYKKCLESPALGPPIHAYCREALVEIADELRERAGRAVAA